jgi:lactoylglutathione lyase
MEVTNMRNNGHGLAVGHIGLNVSDLEVSKMFYQEILGLRVADESLQTPVRYASMEWNGKTVLTLRERNGELLEEHRGLHHLAFEADSIEEVNRTRGLLENLGARWSEPAPLYRDASAICFDDPDGIKIKVYHAPRVDMALDEDANIGVATRGPELQCCGG